MNKEIYRIKTREEFEKEFGPSWNSDISPVWNSQGDMDHLFGLRISKESYDIVQSGGLCISEATSRWNIGKDMVTKEDNKKRKKVMTEEIYRFKTLKEFEDEYGQHWRSRVMYSWTFNMDKLFGKIISEESYNKILCGFGSRSDEEEIPESLEYSISEGMVTKESNKLSKKIKISDKLLKKQCIILNQNN